MTLLEADDRLVQKQEPEVFELLERKLGSRINLHTKTEAVDAYLDKGLCTVIGKDKNHGRKKRFKAKESWSHREEYQTPPDSRLRTPE